jgi:GDP-L-fucose synthase
MKKLLLTGASGFLGRNAIPTLQNNYELFSFGSKDYNLLDPVQSEKMFSDVRPDVVVHFAAKSGGILANKNYAADFWYQNMMITTNIWELSKNYSVKKLVYIMPGCAYPGNAPVPVKEEYMWDGFPDLAPAPSASAKKMGILASYAYRKQYGLNSCVVIPANCYGLYDCFDEMNSHVIPALILKFHKAKIEGLKEITLWGSGKAIRDFIYAEDVINCLPHFIENDVHFPSANPCMENVCNISTEKGTSIKELAETICEVVGYEGEINWDTSKPNGPANKTFSNERMKSLGLNCQTSLREGIEKTYQWFRNQ